MRVAALPSFGGPDAFRIRDEPIPDPGPHELLIRVAAAGVNRADIHQREGAYPPPAGAPSWPGLEVSGTVAAVGADVTEWSAGDQVCALLAGGGYAEYALCDSYQALRVPDGVTMRDAAGLMEAACTAWSNFEAADAQAGETLLVHGGTGGVGSLAIQMGKAIGMRVIATAGNAERVAACLDLGADTALDFHKEDFVTLVKEQGGADVILDVVGAAYLDRNLSALKVGGRLAIIGLQGGAQGQVNLGSLLAKRTRIIGTTLRSRPLQEKRDIVAAVAEHVWPHIPARVRPIIAQTFALEDVAQAHRALEAGGVVGKLLLEP